MLDRESEPFCAVGENHRVPMNTARDVAQAVGTVIDGVHARDHGQEHLRRADIARRLLTADVLLPRLEGHAQRRLAVRVARDADDSAGQMTLVFLSCREECRVRSAETHRHPEALRVADADVGAELARRREQDETHQIGHDGDRRAR